MDCPKGSVSAHLWVTGFSIYHTINRQETLVVESSSLIGSHYRDSDWIRHPEANVSGYRSMDGRHRSAQECVMSVRWVCPPPSGFVCLFSEVTVSQGVL